MGKKKKAYPQIQWRSAVLLGGQTGLNVPESNLAINNNSHKNVITWPGNSSPRKTILRKWSGSLLGLLAKTKCRKWSEIQRFVHKYNENNIIYNNRH